jgi:hypothetical protein
MIEAEGLLVALCKIGADRGRDGPSSGSLCRRRLDGLRSPPSSVGELLVVVLSIYWHLRRLSRQDRQGSPGMSIWHLILRERHLVQAGTLCERYGLFWMGAALAINQVVTILTDFPGNYCDNNCPMVTGLLSF